MNQQSQAFWQLDKTKAARVGQSSYINGNTNDVYQILSAAWKTNQKQNGHDTYYMSLHIMNREKSTAHIDVYYGDASGERFSGENLINATMLCSNVSSLSQVQGQYQEYNYDQQKDITVSGLVAPELAGKKVGMFLADNFYFNQSKGEVKRGGLNLFNLFDADTKQLPNEKANNSPANPETFNAVIAAMIKSSEKSQEKANDAAGISNQPQTGFNNQMGSQGAPQQNNSVSYSRGAPVQQNNQNNAHVNNQALNGGGMTDDDIPFAPFYDGQL